jgi:hypothetical protein
VAWKRFTSLFSLMHETRPKDIVRDNMSYDLRKKANYMNVRMEWNVSAL